VLAASVSPLLIGQLVLGLSRKLASSAGRQPPG